MSDQIKFTIAWNDLLRAIKQTELSVFKDKYRPALCTTHFDITKGNLSVITTDTHRLSVTKIPVVYSGTDTSISIPQKHIKALKKLLKRQSGDILVIIDENIRFKSSVFDVEFATISGFPNYKRVIPTEFILELIMPYSQLLECVTTSAKYKPTANRINFTVEKSGAVIIQCDTGGRLLCPFLVNKSEKDYGFSIDCKYMLDALKSAPCDNVRLRFQERSRWSKPFLMDDGSSDRAFQVIMPMSSGD